MHWLQKNPAHHITIGEIRLPLIVTRNRRAKRLILRYDAKHDCAKLTLPQRISLGYGLQFATGKSEWLAHQRIAQHKIPFAQGSVLPLWGEDTTLQFIGGRGLVQLSGTQLLITGDEAFMARRVHDFIRKQTLAIMRDIAKEAAHRLGVNITNITLRDTSSRWGSCSKSGAISLCWRLAFAPRAVMEYVVLHEVAHLKHHNHSAAFWQVVAMLCPDYERHERWLREHGHTLWRFY